VRVTTTRRWPPEIDGLVEIARRTKGFMPEDEGDLLLSTALDALRHGPGLEVGTWCGRTAVLLGAAARVAGSTVFTVDHHRGSEENQPGWEWHDESLVDPRVGRIDTLPFFRATITDAGLEEEVVGIVGRAPVVAASWRMPLALLFVDGGHTDEHVTNDYEGFGRWVQPDGLLVLHDVFADPAEGGQAPWRCWTRAVEGGDWAQVEALGSMRVLRRLRGEAGDPVR
jgi:predicted O-methyltransferase YrrM